jgi:hypothetical protein
VRVGSKGEGEGAYAPPLPILRIILLLGYFFHSTPLPFQSPGSAPAMFLMLTSFRHFKVKKMEVGKRLQGQVVFTIEFTEEDGKPHLN